MNNYRNNRKNRFKSNGDRSFRKDLTMDTNFRMNLIQIAILDIEVLVEIIIMQPNLLKNTVI